ncbi:lipopolysaccharide assembly protein LapA domain-containing protein [Desulforhabdus amnigena]|jgi:uncharacterized integral membrane protein|uniref:Lipopolysaccharide assembly protein A domain-containing protein n=1 Tax=Desulforhabdus amnigena TaxID=40218 RepID=A0A9W6L7V7_9BACT|nr:lipopolysaccharide assembly protein LapA domain-containing protein [Desulforhabdus amnigena]NLJ27532.1 DUF1049 domain-containing protein [Deltaproteobacteria bacterium]GLI35053.1 hypothetical protein DAMNIGENAA_24860 [Desulforhabdus amnigena]
MKLFKLVLTLLVLGFVGLFGWQNLSAFKQTVSFTLNIYLREPQSWEYPIYVILLVAAMLGLFAGLLLMLKPYFKVRRQLIQERQEKDQLLAAQEAAKAQKQAPPAAESREEPAPASHAEPATAPSADPATEEQPVEPRKAGQE